MKDVIVEELDLLKKEHKEACDIREVYTKSYNEQLAIVNELKKQYNELYSETYYEYSETKQIRR